MRVILLTTVTILTFLWLLQTKTVDVADVVKRGVESNQTILLAETIFASHGLALSSEVSQQFSTQNPMKTGNTIYQELRSKGVESYWSTDQSLRVYSNKKLEFVISFVNEDTHKLTDKYAFLILCKADHKQPHILADGITSIAISPLAPFSFIQAKNAAQSLSEVYLWVDPKLRAFSSASLPYSSGQILSESGTLSYLSRNGAITFAKQDAHRVENENGTLIVLNEHTYSHNEIDLKLQNKSEDSRIFFSEWFRH